MYAKIKMLEKIPYLAGLFVRDARHGPFMVIAVGVSFLATVLSRPWSSQRILLLRLHTGKPGELGVVDVRRLDLFLGGLLFNNLLPGLSVFHRWKTGV